MSAHNVAYEANIRPEGFAQPRYAPLIYILEILPGPLPLFNVVVDRIIDQTYQS